MQRAQARGASVEEAKALLDAQRKKPPSKVVPAQQAVQDTGAQPRAVQDRLAQYKYIDDVSSRVDSLLDSSDRRDAQQEDLDSRISFDWDEVQSESRNVPSTGAEKQTEGGPAQDFEECEQPNK